MAASRMAAEFQMQSAKMDHAVRAPCWWEDHATKSLVDKSLVDKSLVDNSLVDESLVDKFQLMTSHLCFLDGP